jgi:regulator of RNase E activity RraB
MQADIQIEPLKRFNNISRPTVSSGSAETLPTGNSKTERIATKGFSISDVTLLSVLSQPLVSEEHEADMKELARLMVAVTRKFTGGIEHWEFMASDGFHDVVLRCTHRLRTIGNIDHIEVLRGEGNLRLILKKFVGNRSTVYFIPVRPIIELRHRNLLLFHILLSFVKSLPYGGLFPSCESRIDWLWEFLFEDMENYKDNKQIVKNHSTTFYTRNRNFLEAYEIRDWKSLLDEYQPRKPIYRQIKELLLKAETIDFQVPFLLTVKDGYDCMFEHWESFLTVDKEDSAFANGYIQMLNDCSNDYDIISAYQHTVAENGNIAPFDDSIPHRLNQLEEFINDLSELLNEL